MTIRRKVLSILILVQAAMIALIGGVAGSLMLDRHRDTERDQIEEEIPEVLNLFASRLESMQGIAVEYGMWDETFDVIEDANPDYLDDNVVADTMKTLDLTLYAVLDSNNQVKLARAADLAAGELVGPDPALMGAIFGNADSLRPLFGAEPASGIWHNNGITYLLATSPVKHSDRTGESNGQLVIARELTTDYLQTIGELLDVRIDFVLAPSGEADDAVGTTVVSKNEVQTTSRVQNALQGQPLALKLTTARTGYHEGLRWIQMSVAILIAMSLSISVVMTAILDRMVLRRLSALSAEIETIGEEGPVQRVEMEEQHDEVGLLARTLNQTLDRLEEHRAKLARSEAEYRAVVEDQTESIARWRPDGALTFANEAFRKLCGIGSEALATENVKSLLPQETASAVLEDIGSLSPASPKRTIDLQTTTSSGEVVHLEWTDRAFFDETGEMAEVQSVIRDVTELVRAKEERSRIEERMQETQRLEGLGLLAGGIAHDFNNLLVGIQGAAQAIEEETVPGPTVSPMLRQIEQSAQRASELTRQLLAYAGRGQVIVEPISLSSLVEEMVMLVRASVAQRAVVQSILERGLPRVNADATQMRQIILNLIMNASDSLPGGRGEVVIRTHTVAADEDYLAGVRFSAAEPGLTYSCLEVADTGCGMDAAVLKQMFDPFFTTKASRRGLGLAAVMGIVRAHGGFIEVKSEEKQGSTITIGLPALSESAPPEMIPAAVSNQPTSSAASAETQRSILVVDDQEGVRTVVTTVLELEGIEVVCAHDGLAGWDEFRNNPDRWEAVFLDLTMPGMNGVDLDERIQQLRPGTPTVIMTGYGAQEVVARLKRRKGMEVLLKPFSLKDIRHCLSTVLDARSANEQIVARV